MPVHYQTYPCKILPFFYRSWGGRKFIPPLLCSPEAKQRHAGTVQPPQTKSLQHPNKNPKHFLLIVKHLQKRPAHEIHALTPYAAIKINRHFRKGVEEKGRETGIMISHDQPIHRLTLLVHFDKPKGRRGCTHYEVRALRHRKREV